MLQASKNFLKILKAYKHLKNEDKLPKDLDKGPNHVKKNNKKAIGFRIDSQQIEFYRK